MQPQVGGVSTNMHDVHQWMQHACIKRTTAKNQSCLLTLDAVQPGILLILALILNVGPCRVKEALLQVAKSRHVQSS